MPLAILLLPLLHLFQLWSLFFVKKSVIIIQNCFFLLIIIAEYYIYSLPELKVLWMESLSRLPSILHPGLITILLMKISHNSRDSSSLNAEVMAQNDGLKHLLHRAQVCFFFQS